MKFYLIKTCLIPSLVFGILLGTAIPSFSGHKVDISEGMEAIIRQVEETYLSRRGLTFVNLLDKYPVSAAHLLGIGMMSQTEYFDQSQENRRNFQLLTEEIGIFLRQLAEIHEKDPSGVKFVAYDQLKDAFMEGFTGKIDTWAVSVFGVDPKSVRHPSVLHLAVGPGTDVSRDPHGRIPMAEESPPNDIRLLDQVAPPSHERLEPSSQTPEERQIQYERALKAFIPVFNRYIDAWNASTRAYHEGNLDLSRNYYRQAVALCEQAKKISDTGGISLRTACRHSFSEPFKGGLWAASPGGEKPYKYQGPYVMWINTPMGDRTYLKRWNETSCGPGMTPCQ